MNNISSCPRPQAPIEVSNNVRPALGSFTSQDFDICPRSFCADSSSPQISAILVGNFTWANHSLRNSPPNFHNSCADKYQILAREIPYSALRATPGSRPVIGDRKLALNWGAHRPRHFICHATYAGDVESLPRS